MASEIRVDKITSLSGVGTITPSSSGIDITGITTVATLKATTGIVTTLTATTGIVTTLTANTVTSLGAVSGTTGTFSGAVSGTTGTFTSHVSLGDSDQLRFGDSNDLVIQHNGTDSLIQDTGTGDLYIRGSDDIFIQKGDGSETFIACNDDGAVELYHNNSKTLETTSDGAKVTGELDVHKSGTGDVFHVQGNGTGAVVAKVENAYNSDNDRFAILELKSGKGSIRFNSNGDTNEGSITYNMANNTMVFGVNNDSEKLRIQSGGGISFNGDTATANALDDYEEGTFTPKLGGTSNSSTYNVEGTGTYIKIGRKVTVTIRFNNVDLDNNASGTAKVFNMPFTSGHAPTNGNSGVTGDAQYYKVPFSTDHISNWYISAGTTAWIGLVSRSNIAWDNWPISDFHAGTLYINFAGTYFTET